MQLFTVLIVLGIIHILVDHLAVAETNNGGGMVLIQMLLQQNAKWWSKSRVNLRLINETMVDGGGAISITDIFSSDYDIYKITLSKW